MSKREKRKLQLYEEHNQVILEEEWAKYKYWVMARSSAAYQNLRVLFREPVNIDEFYHLIEKLETQKENRKAQVNAFEHVWGYFKKDATQNERQMFLELLDEFRADDTTSSQKLYEHLYHLSLKYEKQYLINSYYFEDV